jgi:hypothetical protein
MINAVMTFLGYALLVIYCVSWTNILHDQYNMWGLIYYIGESLK